MGSSVSKLNHKIYIPEELESDVVLQQLIDKVFNKKIDKNAVIVLIRNHRFSMHNKIRIIEQEYQLCDRSHYYQEQNVEPTPPPMYNEG